MTNPRDNNFLKIQQRFEESRSDFVKEKTFLASRALGSINNAPNMPYFKKLHRYNSTAKHTYNEEKVLKKGINGQCVSAINAEVLASSFPGAGDLYLLDKGNILKDVYGRSSIYSGDAATQIATIRTDSVLGPKKIKTAYVRRDHYIVMPPSSADNEIIDSDIDKYSECQYQTLDGLFENEKHIQNGKHNELVVDNINQDNLIASILNVGREEDRFHEELKILEHRKMHELQGFDMSDKPIVELKTIRRKIQKINSEHEPILDQNGNPQYAWEIEKMDLVQRVDLEERTYESALIESLKKFESYDEKKVIDTQCNIKIVNQIPEKNELKKLVRKTVFIYQDLSDAVHPWKFSVHTAGGKKIAQGIMTEDDLSNAFGQNYAQKLAELNNNYLHGENLKRLKMAPSLSGYTHSILPAKNLYDKIEEVLFSFYYSQRQDKFALPNPNIDKYVHELAELIKQEFPEWNKDEALKRLEAKKNESMKEYYKGKNIFFALQRIRSKFKDVPTQSFTRLSDHEKSLEFIRDDNQEPYHIFNYGSSQTMEGLEFEMPDSEKKYIFINIPVGFNQNWRFGHEDGVPINRYYDKPQNFICEIDKDNKTLYRISEPNELKKIALKLNSQAEIRIINADEIEEIRETYQNKKSSGLRN